MGSKVYVGIVKGNSLLKVKAQHMAVDISNDFHRMAIQVAIYIKRSIVKPAYFLSIVTGSMVLCISGCSTLKKSIEINAPSNVVWEVLTDTKKYSEWNPFFIKAEGNFVLGETVEMSIQTEDKSVMKFSPKIMACSQNKYLQWRGRLLMPGIFDGRHTFTIDSISSNKVEFIQDEKFQGILVPIVNKKPFGKGWEKMNVALKIRAEAIYNSRVN